MTTEKEKKIKPFIFELQGDEGDIERVKLNLIQLAEQQGALKRTETKDEIRFQGMINLGKQKFGELAK